MGKVGYTRPTRRKVLGLERMWDLWLIAGIGFLGSFGHCVGMCGPIAVALSLAKQTSHQVVTRTGDQSQAISAIPSNAPIKATIPRDCCPQPDDTVLPLASNQSPIKEQKRVTPKRPNAQTPSPWSQFRFHLLLNLGRLLSYALVGACIGAIGSVVVAGGQIAGVGSDLRRGMTIVTGLMLIWFGLYQINPQLLPHVPLLNPMHRQSLHQRLQQFMERVSLSTSIWTPFLLGLIWGFIPCGFLYAAQIKAAATTSVWWGGLTLVAFGLGTLPSMVGIGLMSTWLGSHQRQQLFRSAGWVTVSVGLLTLWRTGNQMVDYSGHGALLLLLLTLLARPIGRVWRSPLQYRRALGVGAFILSVVHVLHIVEHAWSWNPQALFFMLPQHQWGIGFGIGAFALMVPLMATSFDWAQKAMGRSWRRLHLLSIPALGLVITHCLLVGTHYFGRVQFNWVNWLMITTLTVSVTTVILARSRSVWRLLSMEKWYVPPKK